MVHLDKEHAHTCFGKAAYEVRQRMVQSTIQLQTRTAAVGHATEVQTGRGRYLTYCHPETQSSRHNLLPITKYRAALYRR